MKHSALRRYEPNQPLWPYLDNGSQQLELSNHDNTNVVRRSLREYGIVLAGPPAPELVDQVSAETLEAEIRAVIEYWAKNCWPTQAALTTLGASLTLFCLSAACCIRLPQGALNRKR